MSRYIDADNMKSTKSIQSANFNTIDYGLKPCPFCGQDANKAITYIEMNQNGITELRINCCMLHILETETIYFHGEPYPKENLIDMWNRRQSYEQIH